jgi:hypothetical protein
MCTRNIQHQLLQGCDYETNYFACVEGFIFSCVDGGPKLLNNKILCV